jgi:hypothetical protein
MDLEVLRRTGGDRQRWLVSRVEPVCGWGRATVAFHSFIHSSILLTV